MTITRRFDGQPPLVVDPEIRGAALVLSADSLAAWLGASLGTPCTVVVRRLRHQPGIRIVVGFDLTTAREGQRLTRTCLASAYADRPGPEMARLLATVAPEHLLAHDPARAVLVTGAAGDRALPLLPVLFGRNGVATVLDRMLPGHRCAGAPRVSTLRYDPERRWTGALEHDDGEPLLLRGHHGVGAMEAAANAYVQFGDQFADVPVRVPGVLGTSAALASTALGRTPGKHLGGSTRTGDWHVAGAALAHLHDCVGRRLPTVEPEAVGVAIERTADRLAVLLPERATDVRELAAIVTRILERTPRDRVPLHGAFTPDRVVVDHDGVPTLLDLDSACFGPSAADVGSLVAATMVTAEAVGMAPRGRREVHAFVDGYTSVRRQPDPFAVGVHAVAARLRTAIQPFSEGAPDWRDQVGLRVDNAWAALDEVCVVGGLR